MCVCVGGGGGGVCGAASEGEVGQDEGGVGGERPPSSRSFQPCGKIAGASLGGTHQQLSRGGGGAWMHGCGWMWVGWREVSKDGVRGGGGFLKLSPALRSSSAEFWAPL